MTNIFDQAASVTKAVINHISSGCQMADKDEQLERHQICQACEKFNKEEYRCGVCSCFLNYKIPLKTSTCPLNKWPNIMNNEVKNE